MITQDLAKMIYNCHAEIKQTNDFIEKLKLKPVDDTEGYLRDRDITSGYYTLGHSIGSSSSRIASISPELTALICEAHLEKLNNLLANLNSQALEILNEK